ncbi:MAG: hypothetical protein JWM57_2888 [Phycisphaerales bacterium]|nr:hypothetical protein [Phycisphaerales bacterium]
MVKPAGIIVGFAACWMLSSVAHAAEPATMPVDPERAYTAMIDKRAGDIVAALKLTDAAAAGRVQAILADRYRQLRDWHAAHDGELKSLGWKADAAEVPEHSKAQIDALHADLRASREAFLARLAGVLSPEQVVTVKDKMTYDKVRVTYAAYQEIVPNLTAEQNKRLMELLVEAREEAIDGGSSEEKSAVFKRYKNLCKAYLISQGHDVNQDYRNWGEAQKKKTAGQATTHAAE